MLIFLHVLFAAVTSATCNTVYDQRQSGKTNVRVEVKDAVIIAVGDGEFGGDYDYSYDYSDLTIKPEKPLTSTSKPSTGLSSSSSSSLSSLSSSSTSAPTKLTTTKPTSVSSPTSFNISQNAAVVLEAENNSIIFPSNKPGNVSADPVKNPTIHKPDHIPVLILQQLSQGNRPKKFLPVKTVEKQYIPSSQIREKAANTTLTNPEELPIRHCSPGFFLDNHNRCKRIRRPVRERPQLPIGLRYDHKPATRSK